MELLRLKCPGCHSSDIESGDSSELAARLPCKGKRGEKPWCLPDNALPSDTPQLAAGRLHLYLSESSIHYAKKKIADFYQETYNNILKALASGKLIHADE